MTVSTTLSKVIYVGTAAVSVYAYPFRIFADTDLVVTEVLISTGVETVLVLTTDYTVSGAGDASGGNVTLVAGNLPSTKKLVVQRTLPQIQAFDLEENDNAPSLGYENAYDKAVMMIQELQTLVDSSIKLPIVTSGVSTNLPEPEGDKALVWATDGKSIVNQTLGEVDTSSIVNGAVTTPKLAALAVTAAKLATDAVETAKIKDDAVTEAKIQLSNNAFLEALDFAGTGIVDLIKANASDQVEMGAVTVLPDGSLMKTTAAPTTDAQIANKKYVDDNKGLGNQVAGTFNYDVSTATGTQAITGVGFQPKAIILLAAAGGTSGSWGFATGSSNFESMLTTLAANDTSNNSCVVYIDGANTAIAGLASFDADGFTLSWVKTNTPTGTLVVNYIALR